MAEKIIIQNMISQLGQSQSDRISKALDVHFADLDERTPEDLLLFARQFAPLVNYHFASVKDPGDWSTFFSEEAAAVTAGNTRPHMALFLAFLELYKKPQEILNRLTGRQLDFYYHDVLRLVKKQPVPDRAHVLVQLKKQSTPISLTPANVFSAGKDNSKMELIYTPTRKQTIINTATVDSLRSIFVDSAGHGIVRYAPIANSSDGVGGALPADEPKWAAFGDEELPPAEVGFAIASPVLRMKEGSRKITLKLTLSNYGGLGSSLGHAFKAYITAEKNWATLDISSATLGADGVLQFELAVRDGEKAVVDYDPAVHGYSYTATAPIIQLLLDPSAATIGYDDFNNVTLQKASVAVEVSSITSLTLESDEGTLDATKAFLPFGAQPTAGSRFMIGYDEALTKKLSQVKIKVRWKDAPSNFASRYANYKVSIRNTSFTAGVAFKDAGSWNNVSTGVGLFDAGDATNEHTFTFTPGSFSVSSSPSTGLHLYALSNSGSHWAAAAASSLILRQPVLWAFRSEPPEARSGFITFSLERDFLHATYRTESARYMMEYSKTGGVLVILSEPYTPSIQGISLSYNAHSDEVSVASTELSDFANPDLQFFHITYFGQMREHGYQREHFSVLVDKRVSLLPIYSNEGELLIGLSNLNPEDSVSLLFQVAEGSDDPDLEPEDISWAVLCDNYWKPLGSEGVVLDTTNQLLRSGIIAFVIPTEATTQNTIVPAGRVWLRAGIAKNVTAVCKMIKVAANAVEVQFADQGNDPGHLFTPLEAGKIAKLKNGIAAVQAVKQPYASFDGAPQETDESFYNRVSERLRHKDRCITAWDYERIVLEGFPAVHKAKCIPHAKEGSWLAPGSVLLVVIPDLQNRNATDILEPKVNANTLDQITDWVRARAGMQVQVKVRNPRYQRIQADFKVKFRSGYEFNYYSEELKKQLIAFLSPWAFQSDREIAFGGKVYKSVLLDFVERRDSVDFVTDFRMYSYLEGQPREDVTEAQAQTPDAILVSDYTHIIKPV